MNGVKRSPETLVEENGLIVTWENESENGEFKKILPSFATFGILNV